VSTELLARARSVVAWHREIAEGATRGPWRWVDHGGKFKSALVSGDWPWVVVMLAGNGDMYPSKLDAEHIAHHDPESVLERCERRAKLLDEFEAALRRVDTFGGGLISTAAAAAMEPWVQAIADEDGGAS
jgi:hypothetical protein